MPPGDGSIVYAGKFNEKTGKLEWVIVEPGSSTNPSEDYDAVVIYDPITGIYYIYKLPDHTEAHIKRKKGRRVVSAVADSWWWDVWGGGEVIPVGPHDTFPKTRLTPKDVISGLPPRRGK